MKKKRSPEEQREHKREVDAMRRVCKLRIERLDAQIERLIQQRDAWRVIAKSEACLDEAEAIVLGEVAS